MNSFEEIEYALNLARSRLRDAPTFEIYVSIVAQLEYLRSVIKGDVRDRSKLKDIIVGHFAVREIEECDPEFAQALMAAQFIASQAAKGLKT
jgi:hypothetical protein